jgi:hypothetical protein
MAIYAHIFSGLSATLLKLLRQAFQGISILNNVGAESGLKAIYFRLKIDH